ncbi:hypothetical protein AMTRI_Chr03g46200 [Amborella trichopoda]
MLIISWNIRSLGLPHKNNAVRDLCFRHWPSILALTKIKLPSPSLIQIRQVWGHCPCQWDAVPAEGASGGI